MCRGPCASAWSGKFVHHQLDKPLPALAGGAENLRLPFGALYREVQRETLACFGTLGPLCLCASLPLFASWLAVSASIYVMLFPSWPRHLVAHLLYSMAVQVEHSLKPALR
eukprot:3257126-Amphidinium_carterae.1